MSQTAEPEIDPTFYRNAAEAMAAAPEQPAYVVAFDHSAERPDALTVVDADPDSDTYGRVVGWADLPTGGDELHHFGGNACSRALQHAGHHMDGLQRRYRLLAGLRSSNIHGFDTHPDPRGLRLVRTIEAAELAKQSVEGGGMRIDERFLPHEREFRGLRVHQLRLQGGDASSDSYCFR